jgi:pilus assembly protein CpaF
VIERQLLGAAAALVPFLQDPEVTDVLVNGTHTLYVERKGELLSYPTPFPDTQTLAEVVERIVMSSGKRIDASRPYLDGRLIDGSRFHIILPPISLGGTTISIRKHRRLGESLMGSFGPPTLMEMLKLKVQQGQTLVIAGSTGAGKTTLLSQLLNEISPNERIVLLEETAEISTIHPHVIRLEARSKTPEGTGEVTLRDLVRNALRMRPDRLILGECRGDEVRELLQALNTGHRGSLCTVHANSSRDALKRLETLLLMACPGLTCLTAREWVSSCVDAIVFLQRMDGKRQVTECLKVLGMEGDVYRMSREYG